MFMSDARGEHLSVFDSYLFKDSEFKWFQFSCGILLTKNMSVFSLGKGRNLQFTRLHMIFKNGAMFQLLI